MFTFARWLPCAAAALLIDAGCASAQEHQSPPQISNSSTRADPLNRTTPQSSVAGFLQACRAHDFTRACSYLDLRKLPHISRAKDGSRLAQQLDQVLERDTRFDVAELSSDPMGSQTAGMPPTRERIDSFNDNGNAINVELERIQLRSGIGVWLFSSGTIDQVPRLARIASETPIEKYLPDVLVTWTMAATALWRWIALLSAALASAAIAWPLCALVLRCCRPLLKPFNSRTDWNSWLQPFVGPMRLLVALALFRPAMGGIDPAPEVRLYFGRALALLFFLGVFWLILGIIDLLQVSVRARFLARHRTMSYSALPLAARVLKIIIFVLMAAALLSEWGYNTTTILASLGVGGIAVALAAQKTIENFFGGVSVVADRPVAVGDFCKFGDRMGTVEDIGLRSTRIRTPDRTLVSVPNGQFSTMTIENFSKRDKMLFHFFLNLRRDTKPDQVRALLDSISTIFATDRKVDPGAAPVSFVGVGTYSLDLEITVYILTADDVEFARHRQELLLAILDAVESAGTALALPTQASIEYVRNDRSTVDGRTAQLPQQGPHPNDEPLLTGRRR